MRKIACVVTAMALAGCGAEGVRDRPPEFVATYDVPWERMTICLQMNFEGLTVTPLINQREKTAALVIAVTGIVAPGPTVAEYRIRQIDNDDRSQVELRRRPGMVMTPSQWREVTDRCARSGA